MTTLWNLAVSAPRPCAMSDAGSQFPHLSVEGLIFPFPIHAQFAKLPPTRSTFPLSLSPQWGSTIFRRNSRLISKVLFTYE